MKSRKSMLPGLSPFKSTNVDDIKQPEVGQPDVGQPGVLDRDDYDKAIEEEKKQKEK